MPSRKRVTITDFAPRSPAREVPVVEARDEHLPVESPARLLHAQLNAGIIAPWQDVATQQSEPRYPGLIRVAVPIIGAASSWAAVILIVQALR